MNYNTYPYGIFNPQYLSQFQAQQMEEQRNLEQQITARNESMCPRPDRPSTNSGIF